MDLLNLIEKHADFDPEKLALGYISSDGGLSEQLSYRQLLTSIVSTGNHLGDLLPPGSRAIILLPAEASFIKFFLGSMHAKIIAVPCPIGYSESGIFRLLNIIQDCGASAIITNRKTHKLLFQRQNPASKELQEYAVQWIFTDDNIPDIDSKRLDRGAFLTGEVAYLQYTSGSTSTPKGVMVTDRNLVTNLSAINNCFGRTAAGTSVTWLPHYHDMGLVDGLLSPLYSGGTGYVIAPLTFITKPLLLLQTISRYHAGFCGGPGFALDHCLNRIPDEELVGLRLDSLQVLYVGAEPIRIATLENFSKKMSAIGFRKNSLVPAYGLAEATLAVSLHLHDTPLQYFDTPDNLNRKAVACGPPVEHTLVLIVDPQTKTITNDGSEGEVWVKNSAVAGGYWENPEATRDTFQAYTQCGQGPFLRTGDLGFIEQNRLIITGRLKELIIIRGVNYYPQDIEEVVSGCHADVQPNATAVFSIDTEDGEAVMVVSELTRVSQTQDNADSIKLKVSQSVSLAFGLVPHDVVLLSPGKLPKTSSGKIQRLKARDIFFKSLN